MDAYLAVHRVRIINAISSTKGLLRAFLRFGRWTDLLWNRSSGPVLALTIARCFFEKFIPVRN